MIIRFPTALYIPVLPTDESGGNVTYTISSSDPPRDFTSTSQIPPAIELKQRPAKTLTSSERRASIGELVFTVSRSSTIQIGSNKKQFEVGQVLDFGSDNEPAVDPMTVGQVEIRHDTNQLDYTTIGLTETEISKIVEDAAARLSSLQSELDGYRQQRAAAEIQIAEIKKTQNETQKAINAIAQLVVTDPSYASVIATLNAKMVVLQTDYDYWLQQANAAATSAAVARDQILAIAQIVR